MEVCTLYNKALFGWIGWIPKNFIFKLACHGAIPGGVIIWKASHLATKFHHGGNRKHKIDSINVDQSEQ